LHAKQPQRGDPSNGGWHRLHANGGIHQTVGGTDCTLESVGGTDRTRNSPNGGSIKRSVAPIEENPPHQGDARNWWVAPIAIGGWHRLRLVGGTDCDWWVAPIAVFRRGVAGMARPQVRKKLARLRPSLAQGWGLPSHPKREHRPKNSRQDR